MQNRFKSKAAWAVLITQIVIVAGLFLAKEDVTTLETIMVGVLLVAEAFGLFNNPTDKEHF